jgi:surface antigen
MIQRKARAWSRPRCERFLVTLFAATLLSTTACATHEQSGATTGAVVGGAVGHSVTRGSFVGTLIGAFVGAAIGADIGRQWDEADRREAAWALEYQRTGEAHRWANPDTGYEYSCTPTRTFDEGGRACRDFVVLTYIDGEPTEVHSTACRDADGTWRAVGQ